MVSGELTNTSVVCVRVCMVTGTTSTQQPPIQLRHVRGWLRFLFGMYHLIPNIVTGKLKRKRGGVSASKVRSKPAKKERLDSECKGDGDT